MLERIICCCSQAHLNFSRQILVKFVIVSRQLIAILLSKTRHLAVTYLLCSAMAYTIGEGRILYEYLPTMKISGVSAFIYMNIKQMSHLPRILEYRIHNILQEQFCEAKFQSQSQYSQKMAAWPKQKTNSKGRRYWYWYCKQHNKGIQKERH